MFCLRCTYTFMATDWQMLVLAGFNSWFHSQNLLQMRSVWWDHSRLILHGFSVFPCVCCRRHRKPSEEDRKPVDDVFTERLFLRSTSGEFSARPHVSVLLFSCIHSVFSSWCPSVKLSRPGFHACPCLLSPRLGNSLHSGCLTKFSCLSPVQMCRSECPLWSPAQIRSRGFDSHLESAENTEASCESEIFQHCTALCAPELQH